MKQIFLSLLLGDISKHGLLIQLANPRLPQRDREAITAVLTFTSAQQQHQQQQFDVFSNNLLMNQLQNLQNLAIVQQTLAAQQQQQQQQMHGTGKRPSTIQPMSQEELQTHANLIMQNALIKRKIEEQTNVLGLQKILQLNAAAQVAKQQQQNQQHARSTNHLNQSNQNSSRNSTGSRRLQALQNLFNDSNGMVDNIQQQQNNASVAGSGGNSNSNANYRYNRNNTNQNQGRRSSVSSSGQNIKFASDVENTQYPKSTDHHHYQLPVATNTHLQNAKTNKIHINTQQPAAIITGGGSK